MTPDYDITSGFNANFYPISFCPNFYIFLTNQKKYFYSF